MPLSREPFLSFTPASSATEARPRLYCFAYAGGSSSVFAPWARALSSSVAVLGVELPGHGSRFDEEPLTSVSEMAEGVAAAIGASTSTAPFAFYGHSLGAVVAFETAQILQVEFPSRLSHLFVGAARAPHLPPFLPAISHLPQQEFLDAVQHRYGGLPAALFEEPELLELVLPVLRADFTAYETYQHAQPRMLECPVTAFHGAKDEVVRNAAVSEWSRVTNSNFRMEVVEGDHFFLNTCRDTLLSAVRNGFDADARTALPGYSAEVSASSQKY